MTISGSGVTRVLTLISGVLAIVLANLPQFHLPVAAQATISGVGGVLLSILAWLEHPTTKAGAVAPTVASKSGGTENV